MRRTFFHLSLVFLGLIIFLIPNFVYAAKFHLSPSSRQFLESCDSAVTIFIDTESQASDAANILINYNPADIEIIDADNSQPGIQIYKGNTYNNFVDNIVFPSQGLIRLTGFSFGEAYNSQGTPGIFGSVLFQGRPGVSSTDISIDYIPNSTTDSNIAEFGTSDDLLTGVTNGSYTFGVGPCDLDTTPPYVTNLNPKANQTGVVLTSPVSFHVKDNQAGVDLDSLEVEIDNVLYTRNGNNQFSFAGDPLDYTIAVNPVKDFPENITVVVSISVKDLDNNVMSPYVYSFNQPPAPPPLPPEEVPPPTCQELGCLDPADLVTECSVFLDEAGLLQCPVYPGLPITIPEIPSIFGPIVPTGPLEPEISREIPVVEEIQPPIFEPEQPVIGQFEVPEITVAEELRLSVADFSFSTAYRTIPLNLINQREIHLLVNKPLSVSLVFEKLPKDVQSIVLILDKSNYFLKKNDSRNAYLGDFIAPNQPGEVPLTVIITYSDLNTDVVGVKAVIEDNGRVYESKLGRETNLNQAVVKLYQLNSRANTWDLVDFSTFRQNNPQVTDMEGQYGFMAPVGRYLMTVQKEGYYPYSSGLIEVRDNLVNLQVKLNRRAIIYNMNLIAAIIVGAVILFLGFIILRKIFKGFR